MGGQKDEAALIEGELKELQQATDINCLSHEVGPHGVTDGPAGSWSIK